MLNATMASSWGMWRARWCVIIFVDTRLLSRGCGRIHDDNGPTGDVVLIVVDVVPVWMQAPHNASLALSMHDA